MKNNCKRLMIMFVMLLAALGFGTIQNGSIANAATIGQVLTQPESGWCRVDDSDPKISYKGDWNNFQSAGYYNSGMHLTMTGGYTASFEFYGTKLRIIGYTHYDHTSNTSIKIDGNTEIIDEYSKEPKYQVLVYESPELSLGKHTVIITKNSPNYAFGSVDAIDIKQSIILDKSSTEVVAGKLQQLTATTTDVNVATSGEITTTTSASTQVEWSSDNIGIATVDKDGSIKGISEGTATITANIKGTDTKATCTVTVTKETEPTDSVGDTNLSIELVNGQVKQYNVSNDEFEKFKQWFKNRDINKSESSFYQFKKGSYSDFVIHDKIVWFQIR